MDRRKKHWCQWPFWTICPQPWLASLPACKRLLVVILTKFGENVFAVTDFVPLGPLDLNISVAKSGDTEAKTSSASGILWFCTVVVLSPIPTRACSWIRQAVSQPLSPGINRSCSSLVLHSETCRQPADRIEKQEERGKRSWIRDCHCNRSTSLWIYISWALVSSSAQ